MSTKRTEVALVLDRSGSMSSIRDEIIDGFNEQLQTLRDNAEKGGETRITLVTFGGMYHAADTRTPVETIIERARPGMVAPLDRQNYVPDGLTPMYDGVMRAISLLERSDDGGDDTAFLVVVLSDGLENHSQEHDANSISTKVRELEGTDRWTFTYIGANQDLSKVQRNTGINSTFQFNASPKGTEQVSASMRAATASYMTSRAAGQTSGGYDLDLEEEENE